MSTARETPLHDVPGWPAPSVRKLAESGITTAEQIVATAATPEGARALASHLGVSEQRMHQLAASARARLAPEVADALEHPTATYDFGFGALKPPDE